MRTWVRVAYLNACGLCHAALGEGQAMLLIEIPNVKRKLIRCENCEGPAPPDLPKATALSNSTKRMTSLSKTAKDVTKRREWMPFTDR